MSGKREMKITRRDHLVAMGSALLAAGSLSTTVDAQDARQGRENDNDAEILYGHGLVWNRALAGIAGELKLAFDLRVNLDTGLGFGTAHDPVNPDYNVHFSIDSAERTRLRRGDLQFMLKGTVTAGNGGFPVGQPVRIIAQTQGDTTAIAIAIGDQAFAGAGLVVIAIIAVLIGLLLPAVQ
jgi:hypothetical protein